MTIKKWLETAQKQLAEAGIDSARLDSVILLEDGLQLDRAYLIAHDDAELAPELIERLAEKLKRRSAHEPLAYIRGFSEFYGRKFFVNNSVLEPRPESESIITLLKNIAPDAKVIADIGTGSGALAITAALETKATVYAIDIDDACLQVAEQNALLHNHSIGIAKGNLLEPFLLDTSAPTPEVVLSNLPYVPNDYAINKAAEHEPRLALFGGVDGLDLYRDMFQQIDTLPTKPRLILVESLTLQHQDLTSLAKAHDYKCTMTDGLIQAFEPF